MVLRKLILERAFFLIVQENSFYKNKKATEKDYSQIPFKVITRNKRMSRPTSPQTVKVHQKDMTTRLRETYC